MNRPLADITRNRVRAGGLLGLLLLAGLLCTPSAIASWEQVKVGSPAFQDPPTEVLEGRTGVAINIAGAGGVSPGTVYVVGRFGSGGVHRYNSKGEFQGAWGGFESFGVAVGPSTGCVYVLRPDQANVVRVFNADGSKELASFGELAAPGETVANSPEKFHERSGLNGITVDSAGNAYVADRGPGGSRIMVFKPQSAGDCEHYSYAGQTSDIAAGNNFPIQPVIDGAGNIYVIVGSARTGVQEFSIGGPSVPICKFTLAAGGIAGLAVDSSTGGIFYYSEADKEKRIHVLQSCDQGGFKEESPAIPQPKPTENFEVLTVNPTLVWEPGRPAGVLYALSPSFNAPKPDYIFAPAVSHEPVVETESVANVSATTASLRAEINPNGAATSFTFQYLTAAAYEANGELFTGATEVPLGGALLGGGQNMLPAAVSVSGLMPETEYRFRVIANSAEGSDEGDAVSFRTFSVQAEGPPDGRAYELVSPQRKNGGEAIPLNPFISSCEGECKPGTAVSRLPAQSSSSGDGIVYAGFPFSADSAPKLDEYLSTRTPSGWQTRNPTPQSYRDFARTGYDAFSADLATGVLREEEGFTLSPEAPLGYPNLFLQASDNPAVFSPLIKETPPNRLPLSNSLHLEYAGATDDLSHVIFAANDALTRPTPFAPEAEGKDETKSNLYEWFGDQLRLVNVLPNGESTPGAVFGSGLKLSEELSAPEVIGVDFLHAISADGSRIFWSSESGQVYVRANGEDTREVLDHEGQFVTASADGSEVLLSDGCLYDVVAESCTDLDGNQGDFRGILGQSEDLSAVYFVDGAALTAESEENSNGEHAEESKNNLYAWKSGSLTFVARLSANDNADWAIAPLKRTAEASPDGRWATFLSREALTGGKNIGPCEGPCPEAFIFDSSSGELNCASCDRSGESPLGSTFLPTLGVLVSSLAQPRYLTDSGRLYFDTRDSLSPFDTNGDAEDVYEYEPQDVGSCTHTDGCTSLASAGREPIDSNFLAIDPTAKNVFFTTRDQLVSADRDDLIDVYDAREGGGLVEERTPGECEGESCQSSSPAPDEHQPGSLGFQGPGNVQEGGARKHHQVRRHHGRKRHHDHKGRHRHGGRAAARDRGGAQ